MRFFLGAILIGSIFACQKAPKPIPTTATPVRNYTYHLAAAQANPLQAATDIVVQSILGKDKPLTLVRDSIYLHFLPYRADLDWSMLFLPDNRKKLEPLYTLFQNYPSRPLAEDSIYTELDWDCELFNGAYLRLYFCAAFQHWQQQVQSIATNSYWEMPSGRDTMPQILPLEESQSVPQNYFRSFYVDASSFKNRYAWKFYRRWNADIYYYFALHGADRLPYHFKDIQDYMTTGVFDNWAFFSKNSNYYGYAGKMFFGYLHSYKQLSKPLPATMEQAVQDIHDYLNLILPPPPRFVEAMVQGWVTRLPSIYKDSTAYQFVISAQ